MTMPKVSLRKLLISLAVLLGVAGIGYSGYVITVKQIAKYRYQGAVSGVQAILQSVEKNGFITIKLDGNDTTLIKQK